MSDLMRIPCLPNIAAAKAALAHIEQDENPATIRSKAGFLLVFADPEGARWTTWRPISW
jgi:hypothetical protein